MFKLHHLHDLPVGLPAPVTYRHGQHHTAAAAPSLKAGFKTFKSDPEDKR